MGNWRDTTLGLLLRIKHGFAFLGEHFSDTGTHVVLTPGNFSERGGFRAKGEKEKWYRGPIPPDYVLRRGDVLVAMTEQAEGLLGSSAVVPEDGLYLHNQRLGLVQVRDGADRAFVYHLFNTRHVRQQIRASASGTKVRHTSPTRIEAVKVRVPDLAEQRRIAAILSAYDDLIDNCERRIGVLDEMARALYREWFVLFRYPGHEKTPLVDSPVGRIPTGWRHVSVKELAEVTYGYPFASASFSTDAIGLPIVRIRDILDGVSRTFTNESADERYLIKNGDILVGMDGDFHMCIWWNGPALQNQRVARFGPSPSWARLHFYLALEPSIQLLNKAIVGTTVAHLGDMHIKKIAALVPDDRVLVLARHTFQPLGDEMTSLRCRSELLRKARDLLLPRLLSGQLSVEDAA